MHDETRGARLPPYESSLEHVLDAFARVDAMIRGSAARARDGARGDDPYRGLYISDADFERLLSQSTEPPAWSVSHSLELQSALAEMEARAAARLDASQAELDLRLPKLCALFDLDDRDQDLLLLALAPELSLKFELAFAYLQDDLTKKRLTVDLALDILGSDFADRLALRNRLLDHAPLVRHGLLECFDEPQSARPSSLGRCLRIDPRIAAYLLDDRDMDVALARHAALLPFPASDEPSHGDAQRLAYVDRALALYRRYGDLKLHLHGSDRRLRLSWALALCGAASVPLLSVDLGALAGEDDAAHRFDRTLREAKLLGAAIFVDDFDDPRAAGLTKFGLHVLETLAIAPSLSIVGSGRSRLGFASQGDGRICVAVEPPSARERASLWASALSGAASEAALRELPAIASKFVFDGERILQVAGAAQARARWRDEAGQVEAADLHAACREQSVANFGALAERIPPRQTWSDLVLPEDTLRQLREICDRVRRRETVLESWGFERKQAGARALSVLFSGPSGVGKTMAAEVIAAELGVDLYRIDLSAVVNKYIGETEKNLARVFAEAETANVILFFDEADALFGKRSEVQDARDRYANLETSYLLQRMESFSGVSILASNLRRNMDDAFTRRLGFIVQFTPPEAPERLAIWRRSFPEDAPLGHDVDLHALADQFRLTGASIKSIALASAFLAAGDCSPISMSHLVAATRRELLKHGRSASKSEFGAFGALLDANSTR